MTSVPADLFLSATLTADEASQYLAGLGFADPGTADTRLQALAEGPAVREALARVADVLLDAVQRTPDPDAALAAFVPHVEVRPGTVTPRLAAGLSAVASRRAEPALDAREVPPTLEDPAALDLVAGRLDMADADSLRERLVAERIAIRAICRGALERF